MGGEGGRLVCICNERIGHCTTHTHHNTILYCSLYLIIIRILIQRTEWLEVLIDSSRGIYSVKMAF